MYIYICIYICIYIYNIYTVYIYVYILGYIYMYVYIYIYIFVDVFCLHCLPSSCAYVMKEERRGSDPVRTKVVICVSSLMTWGRTSTLATGQDATLLLSEGDLHTRRSVPKYSDWRSLENQFLQLGTVRPTYQPTTVCLFFHRIVVFRVQLLVSIGAYIYIVHTSTYSSFFFQGGACSCCVPFRPLSSSCVF
jgi:hypothetical protein